MTFEDYLKPQKIKETIEDVPNKNETIKSNALMNESSTPEELLRAGGLKIKLVAPTKFGTQIDFAKKYKDEDIKKILKDYTIKFDGKSVFVIN